MDAVSAYAGDTVSVWALKAKSTALIPIQRSQRRAQLPGFARSVDRFVEVKKPMRRTCHTADPQSVTDSRSSRARLHSMGNDCAVNSCRRAGPHHASETAAPKPRITPAAQNGAVGAMANKEPALIDPSAWPRLPAAAC